MPEQQQFGPFPQVFADDPKDEFPQPDPVTPDTTPVSSEIPVVNIPKMPLPLAPVWGLPQGFTVGDMDSRTDKTQVALNSAANNTKSAPITGSLRYHISAFFSDPNATCTLNVYRVDPGGDTRVKTYNGVSRLSAGLYVGGQDLIDLQGLPIKIEVVNLTSGQITVNVAGH